MGYITNNPAIDDILLSYQSQLGNDFAKYRNHVYRVFNLAVILSGPEEDDYNALAIAAAFHDIGIWTAKTFDYLEPSVQLSYNYLKANGLSHMDYRVAEIINNHHKLTNYKLPGTIIEAFRKADLIDLSFGLFSFGINRKQQKELNRLFPKLGFHLFIVWQTLKNTLRHPLNPLPMMKW